jgi:hypothetical protein
VLVGILVFSLLVAVVAAAGFFRLADIAVRIEQLQRDLGDEIPPPSSMQSQPQTPGEGKKRPAPQMLDKYVFRIK